MTSGRFTRSDGLRLLGSVALGELMRMAHDARMRRHPEGLVTFVCDTNPNYTNVCVTGCRFCAFCRNAHAADAYTLTPDELAERVQSATQRGATTVLLQGGHNPAIGLADWLAYIRAIRAACPGIHVHPFSPPEIIFTARREQMAIDDVLRALRHEGIDTIPGGGAEVLSDRVRSTIAPGKCTAADWLAVMEQAHALGFKTTATLMFGHVEADDDIVEHFIRLREVQDRTSGFTSFVPWSFKPGGSPLTEQVPAPAHPARYLRIIATARLMLDNFPHVQSSWFSESITAGSLGLLAGADDFGGILVEENVLRQAGYRRQTNVQTVLSIIRRSGFIPARRDSHYRIVERYPDEPAAEADA